MKKEEGLLLSLLCKIVSDGSLTNIVLDCAD